MVALGMFLVFASLCVAKLEFEIKICENIWGGLIFVSCGSVLSFIFYHMKCEFVAEPMQLAENEIVIRNAVGETVILRFNLLGILK